MTKDSQPRAGDLWRGIGGHFDSFDQVVIEFIDNSVSNFIANGLKQRNISIILEKVSDGERVRVTIEDTGTGIDDFEPVMRLGERSERESPLNEHGFGLKHALASANQSNDNWKICTRTENENDNQEYRRLEAPYEFQYDPGTVDANSNPWPGEFSGSGTYIQFECDYEFFNTVQEGIPGKVTNFDTLIEYVQEDIGYAYAGLIEDYGISISIEYNGKSNSIGAVTPNFVEHSDSLGNGETTQNLGNGDVTIDYEFGEVSESNYHKYYRRNIRTSGVEIRLNGRLIEDGLFTEIWGTEKHPSYNWFLGMVNLRTEDMTDPSNLDKLPDTKTAKNGIRLGDNKLEKLYTWIKSSYGEPTTKHPSNTTEHKLVEDLKKQRDTPPKNQKPEFRLQKSKNVFTKLDSSGEADLYEYDGSTGIMIEAKKDRAGIDALYQLRMYWDGAVNDGLEINEGWVVAANHTSGLEQMVDRFNKMEDINGEKYDFQLYEWKELGVNYPT